MKKFLNQGISTSLAIGIIIILVIIAGGAILAYQYYYLPKEEINIPMIEPITTETNQPAVQNGTADWKTYQNDNYEFKYPSEYTVKVDSYEAVDLEKEGSKDLSIEVSYLNWVGMGDFYLSFEEYAVAKLEATCMADGPSQSIYCDKAISVKNFKNENNVDFYEIYLNKIYVGEDAHAEIIGPFFAADNSTNNSEKNKKGIFFTPGIGASIKPGMVDKEVMNKIVSTFKFTK
jgi:hypothetical protein